MATIHAIYENGVFRPTSPVNLPDGTEVTVLTPGGTTLGLPEDQWPMDAEGIAHLVARMDQVEPFEMTPQEEADIENWRRQVKEYTLAHQDKAIEDLFE